MEDKLLAGPGPPSAGAQLMRQADSFQKWACCICLRASNLEQAAEAYARAGAQFVQSENWEEAATAYSQAAKVNLQLDERVEAVNMLIKAMTSQKRFSPPDALATCRMACNIASENGDMPRAAKLYNDIAEMEEVADRPDQAIQAYEQCASCLFKAEPDGMTARHKLLRAADISARVGAYPRAIEIYESVAQTALEKKLNRYGAPGILLKSFFTHFALEASVAAAGVGLRNCDKAEEALERYVDMCPTMLQERFFPSCKAAIEAYKQGNVEQFKAARASYTRLGANDMLVNLLFDAVLAAMERPEVVDLQGLL